MIGDEWLFMEILMAYSIWVAGIHVSHPPRTRPESVRAHKKTCSSWKALLISVCHYCITESILYYDDFQIYLEGQGDLDSRFITL